ncbi:MAG: divalent-cation tolerance protein CutA [Rhodospirillaceae bacterium]|nr:divalent-cation tolerance protein CutA [Rhodospirillaceae bacterium]
MIYVTTGSRAEAVSIARALVEERLVACANILSESLSIYKWQGKVEETQEIVLIAKTRGELTEKVIARVKELHSYDVPCVAVYAMVSGLPDYLAWIHRETG